MFVTGAVRRFSYRVTIQLPDYILLTLIWMDHCLPN